MQSPNTGPLQTVCSRYGPRTDRTDIAAGYTAALGAILVSALYITSVWVIDSEVLDIGWSPYFTALEFHWAVYSAMVGLVFAVPTAFFVGATGWHLAPTQTTFRGAVNGAIGAVVTYLLAVIPIATTVFVFEVTSKATGRAFTNALELSALTTGVGFILTWWLAIPIGCIAGVVHVARQSTTG